MTHGWIFFWLVAESVFVGMEIVAFAYHHEVEDILLPVYATGP